MSMCPYVESVMCSAPMYTGPACTVLCHMKPQTLSTGSVGTRWICGPGLSWVLLTSGRRHSNKKP